MEKAILDYLYLNPALRIANDFASLRINREEMLGRLRMERLIDFAQRFNQKRLLKTIDQFLSWLEYA